jgi:hypothetical protein
MSQNQQPQDANELFAHRHDPDEWEEEPEPIVVRPSHTSVVSVRIPTEDLDAIEQIANQRQQTIAEYICAAIKTASSCGVDENQPPVQAVNPAPDT